jgi:hypothetical protein
MLADGEVPHIVQRRALALGLRTKDAKLLAALASTPSLANDIDDELRTVPTAVVRQAWIARPGRRPEEISSLIDKEKRIGALAALASFEGLSDATYRKLAAHERPKVVSAVAANEKVSLDIRCAAMVQWTKLRQKREATMPELMLFRQLLEAEAAFVNPVADVAADKDTLKLVASHPELGVDQQQRIVDTAVRPAFNHQGLYRRLTGGLDLIDALCVNPSLDGTVAALLHDLVEAFDVDAIITETYQKRFLHDRCTAIVGRLADHDLLVAVIAEVASCTDPVRLDELLEDGPRGSRRQVAYALATNPAAPPALIGRACTYLPGNLVLELVAGWGSDTERLIEVFARWPHALSDDALRGVAEPVEVLKGVAHSSMSVKPYVWAALLRLSDTPLEVLLELRPTTLASLTAEHPEVGTKLALYLDDLLGDDTSQWQIVEGLWDSFDGPVSALLSSAQLVADT